MTFAVQVKGYSLNMTSLTYNLSSGVIVQHEYLSTHLRSKITNQHKTRALPNL